MRTHQYDDFTIERWRLEPRFHPLELTEQEDQEQAPPLWKDLTLAAIVALVFWVAAAIAFG